MKGWTEKRVARLKQLAALGWTASQISFDIGAVTRNAVIGKLRRLNKPIVSGRKGPEGVREHSRSKMRTLPNCITDTLARPPEPPQTIEPAVTEGGQLFTLLDLTPRSCRFPIGDPQAPDFHFCGQPRDGATFYCRHHRAICYQRVSAKRADALADAAA